MSTICSYDITQVSWRQVREGTYYISADSRHGKMIVRDAPRLYRG